MSLTIIEHKSASYAPRTYHNAHTGDLTIAIALDFNTAGEKLTKKAALNKGALNYLSIDIQAPPIESARSLYVACKRPEKLAEPYQVKTLNVAGNGIYTLVKAGYNQEQINRIVYDIISPVHQHHQFTHIVSGGQTGIDMAGAVVGIELGIPVTLTFPKGYKMRTIDNKDSDSNESEIRFMVNSFVEKLHLDLYFNH